MKPKNQHRVHGLLGTAVLAMLLYAAGCGDELKQAAIDIERDRNIGSMQLASKSPCPPGAALDNAIAEYGEAATKAYAKAKATAWKQSPIVRGNMIEDALAKTEYSDYYHIGKEGNGFFPVVDFQKGDKVVSLKTVDPSIKTIDARVKNLEQHIDDLELRPRIDGQVPERVLDIRVPPGSDTSKLDELVTYGKEHEVKVIIQEF